MSIKFPDFQILVSRSEQVPRPAREGDQSGAAGKMAAQVAAEFEIRRSRIDEARAQEKVRRRKEKERYQGEEKKEREEKKRRRPRRRIDLRA
ncbi:MAG TPA: hypothetical protein GX528_05490 [Firmicutes bacterium]|nr:hypothetical protein [Bacillota bacterium]